MDRDIVGRPMEILLIEDDLEDAGLTIEALRKGEVPCRISLVRDGEEAMEFLLRSGKYRRAPQPDLILLDLNLPKKSGREVLVDVRANERLTSVPVVVLTSSHTHQEILESENLRVESYLTKPVDLAHFYTVVKSLRRYMLSDVILPQ
jgi:two-component system, chemotaxis family, response regulator Rcp1